MLLASSHLESDATPSTENRCCLQKESGPYVLPKRPTMGQSDEFNELSVSQRPHTFLRQYIAAALWPAMLQDLEILE